MVKTRDLEPLNVARIDASIGTMDAPAVRAVMIRV